jgi:Tfp pilus assembly protein PilO
VASGVWVVAAILLVAGYARIEFHQGGRLAAAEARESTLRRQIARAEGVIRDRVRLRTARRHILDDIRAQGAYGRGAELAPLLLALDRSARRTGMAIVSVEPEAPTPMGSSDRWLSARNVKLVFRGKFAHFLAFVPALEAADPLLQFRDVAISSAERRRAGVLVFTVGASAFSVRDSDIKEYDASP